MIGTEIYDSNLIQQWMCWIVSRLFSCYNLPMFALLYTHTNLICKARTRTGSSRHFRDLISTSNSDVSSAKKCVWTLGKKIANFRVSAARPLCVFFLAEKLAAKLAARINTAYIIFCVKLMVPMCDASVVTPRCSLNGDSVRQRNQVDTWFMMGS